MVLLAGTQPFSPLTGILNETSTKKYCFICGHRRVAVARYRMICLVLLLRYIHHFKSDKFNSMDIVLGALNVLEDKIEKVPTDIRSEQVEIITTDLGKMVSFRTFNTRSRHAFPIAILVLLLPKSSITKQVCSNSTFNVFHMIPHLATARIQNFFTLHVAI